MRILTFPFLISMHNNLIHNSEGGVEIVNRYFLHANETHNELEVILSV